MDVGKVGLGGELSQEDAQGQLLPVAYFSRALAKRQRSYSTYDREVMAMRDTLKNFRKTATEQPHISTHQNEHGLFTRDHKKQVLLPASLVPTILSLAHDETGYQGADKILSRIEPRYCWPKTKAEVENYAKTCKRCAATLAQGDRNAPIHQRPREEIPFALIEVDLKGHYRE
ncbi:Hypothetical predicted protein [Paramuricea clavata]|uniref:Uncharacterized protein n=1 Tax=Paramuricea clavata TaxID=317549 RepID=A0A6S7HPX1_PARCT|nr:Hypothetical predicted protein [Paramuricea clavata]